ncbi:MAG UNVERIFIED_CONTAM: hypothetical protein LVT10_03090 [Anaerolineae bacterium]
MKFVPRIPLIIVLDNVRSAYNVGSILRTADCAWIEQVITCGYTPPAHHPKVKKTSLGGNESCTVSTIPPSAKRSMPCA